MKHAVCAIKPDDVLYVTTLPAKDAVAIALIGREVPAYVFVCEVADEFKLGDVVPDDAPVVWFYRSTRFHEASHAARA